MITLFLHHHFNMLIPNYHHRRIQYNNNIMMYVHIVHVYDDGVKISPQLKRTRIGRREILITDTF